MSEIRRIQREAAEWATYNFGDNVEPDRLLLGIMEELGELCHAHLKQVHGIRTGEDHEATKRDAVGDIFIFLCGYCSRSGIDLEDAIEDTWARVSLRDWKTDPEHGHARRET